MSKILSLIIFLGVSDYIGFAQDVTNSQQREANHVKFFMGLNTGLDYDLAYTQALNVYYDYSYKSMMPRYNIGFDMGLVTSKKLRTRLEMKFVNVKFGIDYGATYINPEPTVMNINYFDFNFHLDYLLLNKSKFQFYISPAAKYEFKIGEAVGGNNFNFLNLDHPNNLAGAAVSAIAKYNFTEHFGITFTPEYTCYFSSFAPSMNKPYQRVSINLGVELTF